MPDNMPKTDQEWREKLTGEQYEILRKKGAVLAQKKASRTTKEGILSCDIDPKGKSATLVEVNCETDFVAKNADFQRLVYDLAKRSLEVSDLIKVINLNRDPITLIT